MPKNTISKHLGVEGDKQVSGTHARKRPRGGDAGLRLTGTAGLRPTTVTANLTLDPRGRAFARARSRCLAETPETLTGPIVPATAQPLLTVPPRTAAPARVSLLRDVKRNTVLPLAHV